MSEKAVVLVAATVLLTMWALWRIPQEQVEQVAQSLPPPATGAPSAVGQGAQNTEPSGREEILKLRKLEDDYRKTLAQGIFGVAVFFSMYVAYRRVIATEEAQITERFTKAIDHLGDSERSKILGGIFALARIGLDSHKDADSVLEILSAFLRDNFPNSKPIGSPQPAPALPRSIAQAAISAIGRVHKKGRSARRLNLQQVDLSELDLDSAFLKDANFRESNLSGCDLTQANLENADFFAADLTKAAFAEALVRNANFDRACLHGANFLDARSLQQVQLRQAKVDVNTFLPYELDYSSALDL